ncbi:MAG: DUF1501 domain-containing protein [Planctomycetota bacterium]|nr:DUF1501 domain-containing protein [Planctomycetota bacterium]
MNEILLTRRESLNAGAAIAGVSLASMLQMQSHAAPSRREKSCIVIYCWGGISHHESWDPKPDAPKEIRGIFNPISTATPGVFVSEHIPLLAQQTEKLAIIRSIHHSDSAHGRGMYWNMTGHMPPANRPGNIAPTRDDWPSLAAMVSEFRAHRSGVPRAVRLPYPMVDNGTLQAGEYGGWLGAQYDPIVMRTPAGKEFGGVSRTLGSEVLNLKTGLDEARLTQRHQLMTTLERRVGQSADFESFDHFRDMASGILLSSGVKTAYDLDREDPKNRERYGDHIGGQSLLLARRLTEVGVPIVQVICSAGDLNGGAGDMWDTHSDNFNRLKDRLLPVYDRGASALLMDLEERGRLDDTLVVFLTDFGRTPRINGGAGRDHYPNAYSVVLAGGGIKGGQVYGSSDSNGAHPQSHACGPEDLHATIFQALGISPRAEIRDMLNRPFPVSDGKVLPLF